MFPDVKCGHDGLPPVHAGIWNGFIFVNFAEEPEETLEEFLGEAGRLFGELPFHEYKHEIRFPQPLATNWKHISNAFTEGYHLGFLHKRSEEHTSELQSQMRISYAVFRLHTKYNDIRSTQKHTKTKIPNSI